MDVEKRLFQAADTLRDALADFDEAAFVQRMAARLGIAQSADAHSSGPVASSDRPRPGAVSAERGGALHNA